MDGFGEAETEILDLPLSELQASVLAVSLINSLKDWEDRLRFFSHLENHPEDGCKEDEVGYISPDKIPEEIGLLKSLIQSAKEVVPELETLLREFTEIENSLIIKPKWMKTE